MEVRGVKVWEQQREGLGKAGLVFRLLPRHRYSCFRVCGRRVAPCTDPCHCSVISCARPGRATQSPVPGPASQPVIGFGE